MSENGQLPPSELAPIQNGRLAIKAAAAWNAMNVEARSKGTELRPTGSKSSYRTYAQQVELYNAYLNGTGNLAAKPGTSNHGWGLAVDVATQSMRSTIDRVGEKYGWAKKWSDAPSEWWHIKYRDGVWSGKDPGPFGKAVAPPPPQPPIVDATVGREGQVTVRNQDGRLEHFTLAGGTVRHRWQAQPGGVWAPGWHSLDQSGGEMISVIANKDGRLEVFALKGDGDVVHRWQDKPGGAWHAGWAGLGAVNTGKHISTSLHAGGRVGVFVEAANGDVWTREQKTAGGGFGNWYSLGGSRA
jgi:hypothetical protein